MFRFLIQKAFYSNSIRDDLFFYLEVLGIIKKANRLHTRSTVSMVLTRLINGCTIYRRVTRGDCQAMNAIVVLRQMGIVLREEALDPDEIIMMHRVTRNFLELLVSDLALKMH
ncbi:hypothetical protein CEXT_521871 [Caerostris extrusa]|uniref:Uncharacterized protein n=1 Tax=Caerostris extrusa TaxID=172846 RepID=A0AAV4XYK6_CAEEX|nr:hypothetical protein CEXT_521871 [Caerostris extrusa]